MHFGSKNLALTDTTFTLLRDLIEERTGLEYPNSRAELLGEKLAERAIDCGFSSFLDYYYLLKYDDKALKEWTYLLDSLSVQETFFWREIDQIKALVDVLVPEYLASKPNQTMRIWSAACATGEEPLTIAMALNEAGWFENASIEIYASDASQSAIDKAINGVYQNRSFRNLPANLKAKYFQKEQDNQWRIIPEIHARINWQIANLMEYSETKKLANASVIFCRNVFIYFSDKAICKTVKEFYNAMESPGYLCVAASESLLKLTNDFELQEIGGAFIYVKR